MNLAAKPKQAVTLVVGTTEIYLPLGAWWMPPPNRSGLRKSWTRWINRLPSWKGYSVRTLQARPPRRSLRKNVNGWLN